VFAIDGGAVALTDLAHGVRFDADGDGQAELIAWTVPGSHVGILALDLNGDGLITTGAEILGHYADVQHGQRLRRVQSGQAA
jgi:hypothetical protein